MSQSVPSEPGTVGRKAGLEICCQCEVATEPTDGDANQHQRDASLTSRTDPNLGFSVSLNDSDPRVQGRHAPVVDQSMSVKPHPSGFQVTLWWREQHPDHGEIKRQHDAHPDTDAVLEDAEWHPDDADPLGAWE